MRPGGPGILTWGYEGLSDSICPGRMGCTMKYVRFRDESSDVVTTSGDFKALSDSDFELVDQVGFSESFGYRDIGIQCEPNFGNCKRGFQFGVDKDSDLRDHPYV